MSVSSLILAASPIAYLKGDEASGSAMADASGNGHGATLAGTYTRAAASLTGEGGTYAVALGGGYATIPADAAFARGTGDLTVLVFIRTVQAGIVVAAGNSSDWWVGVLNGKATLSIGASLSSVGDVNDGQRHLVVATRAGGTVRVYVDGLLDSTPTTNTTPVPNSGNVGVGAFEADVGGFHVVGDLDDFAFLATALSADAIFGLAVAAGLLSPLAAGNPTLADVGVTGATVTISPTGGTGTRTYQWHAGDDADFAPTGGTAIAGATSATLTMAGLAPGSGRWVRCVVDDAAGVPSTSSPRLVPVGSVPIGLLSIGDSTSVTPDADACAPAVTARLLRWAVGVRQVTAVNAAVSGTDTEDWDPEGGHYANALDAVDGSGVARADFAVVVRLGTNDAQLGVAAATFGARLSALVTALLGDGFRRVVLSLPLFREVGNHAPTDANINFDESAIPRLVEYQAVIASLANGQTVLLGDVTSFAATAARPAELMYDRIHPNAAGAIVMAQADAAAVLQVYFPGYSSRDLAPTLANLAAAVASRLAAEDYAAPDNDGIADAVDAADAAQAAAQAAATRVQTALPDVAPAAAGGLLTRGTGAGQVNPDGTGKVTTANPAEVVNVEVSS